jgi:signal transduction histidine kinase
MFKNGLFQKHFGITILIVLLFVILGLTSTHLIMRTSPPPLRPDISSSRFVARLIDHFNPSDHEKGFQLFLELNQGSLPHDFFLLDAQGKVILPKNKNFPFDWNQLEKPQAPETPIHLKKDDFGPPINELVQLKGQPTQYLFMTFKGPPGGGPPPPKAFFISFASLLLSIFLGIGVSLMILFRSLREKATLADSVITSLQSGNLKARFPIKKMDEIGKAMSRFNLMADEIERLVEQLKQVESSRMKLLQELAHDLRTPVASLKNLLETVLIKGSNMAPTLREELLSLSLKEVDYFERLVEDLLVLAQVSEPRYHDDRKFILLDEILDDEAETTAAQYSSQNTNIKLRKSIPTTSISVVADSHLMRRMIRNALDNAFSFANSEVTVSLSITSNGDVCIQVEDDGPGMTPEAIQAFGERRISRVLGHDQQGRLSVGLGSVIMKTVASIHRGKVTVSNRTDAIGTILGTRVEFFIPK